MIGLLVTGSRAFAAETATVLPRPAFWRRVMDWFLGW
jgi:hypothetical protein